MNAIKQNIFWILLAVVLVIAGVFWLVKVSEINAQADQLTSQLDRQKRDLRWWRSAAN